MQLRDKINKFANDKYDTLVFISENVTDVGQVKTYLHSTEEFIMAFYDYISDDIIDKLTRVYSDIVAAFGLDPDSFDLTAYKEV